MSSPRAPQLIQLAVLSWWRTKRLAEMGIKAGTMEFNNINIININPPTLGGVLSPLQPQNAVGVGGGGGRGVSRLRFPPGPHLRSSRFSRHPRLRQAPTRRFAKNRNLRGLVVFVGKRPQAPGGPGPKPWGPGPQAPWRPGPQAPGAWIPPLSPVDDQVFNFLLRLKQNATITPSPLTLGGLGWFPKAELYSSMRGGVPSSLQHFSRWARPQGPENLANKILSPASRSRIPKMPRCSSAHEKPGLLHRLISCAQSLQPSLPFLLRRNNKVQGARS